MTRRKVLTPCALALACILSACSPATKAAQKETRTLRVAVLFTTAGSGGDLAQAVLGAAGLVAEEAKREGVALEIVQLDYIGQVSRVPGLLAQAKANADALIVGTNDSAVAAPLRAERELPILYPLLADDSLLSNAPNAFRFGPSNIAQAQTLVEFLVDHRKYKRIALLTEDTGFGREGRTDLSVALTRSGLSPVVDAVFSPGGDIHTPVARAGQSKADALIVWSSSESEAARVVVEVHKMSFAFQIALSGNLANATFAKSASAQVTPVAFRDGLLSVGPWAGPWFRLSRIVGFYERFQEENSALAPVGAASVYDAMLALVRAAGQSGTGPAELVGGLESLRDFSGAGVPLTFDATKHEGLDPDDLAVWAFTKNQDSAGGDFFPDVDTGGGFFTILHSSLKLPKQLQYLDGYRPDSPGASPEGSPGL